MILNRIRPLDYDPGSVVYEHVRRIVEGMIWKALRMGYDEMETRSAANFGFAVALQSYSEAKGDFVKWVKYKVRCAIIDTPRRKKYRRGPTVHGDVTFDPADPEYDAPPAFDLTAVLVGLSDDAKAWVSLVLEPPDSVVAKAKELGWDATNTAAGIEAAKYRSAVFTFLRESGWSNRRITAAYLEACEALGGAQ